MEKIENSAKIVIEYQINKIKEAINEMNPLMSAEEIKKGFIQSQKDTLEWLKNRKEFKYVCNHCEHYFNEEYTRRFDGWTCCPACLNENYKEI